MQNANTWGVRLYHSPPKEHFKWLLVCGSLLLTLQLYVTSSCERKAFQGGQPCSALAIAILSPVLRLQTYKCQKRLWFSAGMFNSWTSFSCQIPNFYVLSLKQIWALKWPKIPLMTSLTAIETDIHKTTFSHLAAVKWQLWCWHSRAVIYSSASFLPLWRWLLVWSWLWSVDQLCFKELVLLLVGLRGKGDVWWLPILYWY